MDLLRWILLIVGLLLIGAIWLHGRRQRSAHEAGLFDTARRRWRRKAETADPSARENGARKNGPRKNRARDNRARENRARENVDLPEREAPDLGLDIDGLDDIFGHQRESIESRFETWSDAPGSDQAEHDSPTPVADEPDFMPGATTAEDTVTDVADDDRHDGASAAAAESDRQSPADPAADRTRSRSDAARDEAAHDDTATEERIIVLYVVAPRGERLQGADLLTAFSRLGLEHGDLDIFHRHDDEQRTVFSVANAAEPGTFDPATMRDITTPGVALFTRLPAGIPAPDAFDELAAAARALATDLDGHALDGRQSTLTRQTEQAMRDELLEFEHRRNRTSR